jgi:hypothetical protein
MSVIARRHCREFRVEKAQENTAARIPRVTNSARELPNRLIFSVGARARLTAAAL